MKTEFAIQNRFSEPLAWFFLHQALHRQLFTCRTQLKKDQFCSLHRKNHGVKGLKKCDEWRDFSLFKGLFRENYQLDFSVQSLNIQLSHNKTLLNNATWLGKSPEKLTSEDLSSEFLIASKGKASFSSIKSQLSSSRSHVKNLFSIVKNHSFCSFMGTSIGRNAKCDWFFCDIQTHFCQNYPVDWFLPFKNLDQLVSIPKMLSENHQVVFFRLICFHWAIIPKTAITIILDFETHSFTRTSDWLVVIGSSYSVKDYSSELGSWFV